MKPFAYVLLSALGLPSTEGGSQAQIPTKAPPAGMSWQPNDVWRKVKPTTPADFWPLPPPEENQPEGAKKKRPGKKSGGPQKSSK